ncbi:MAG: hemolysin family protein [Xanthobacteraceae bacterium]
MLECIAVVLLLLFNGFLAMSEMAIVSSRRSRLEQLANEGNANARLASTLAADPSCFLTAVQMGMTLIGILAGVLSANALADRIEEWIDLYAITAPYGKPMALGIVVVVVTYLTLIIGELVPKQIALKNPELIALHVARPLALFAKAAAPFGYFVDASARFVIRRLGIRPGFERPVTGKDIQSLVRAAERSGALDKIEREMVEGVLDLENRAVRTIMTPRPLVVWVDLDEPEEAIVKTIRDCPYAQLVVSRGSIDEIAGIVRKQDLLEQALDGHAVDVEKALQPPLIVPEGASILRTLDLFRKTPVNTSLVVDEYGTIQGIVTRTDLLEAVAGDLPDVDLVPEPKVTRREDGSLLMDASMPIADLTEMHGFGHLPRGDFVTLAGFVLAQLGHVPEVDDQFIWNGWNFQVIEMDGRRVDKIVIKPVQPA